MPKRHIYMGHTDIGRSGMVEGGQTYSVGLGVGRNDG